jgi:hypothetical protein
MRACMGLDATSKMASGSYPRTQAENIMKSLEKMRSFVVHGALAGALAAATMTVLRMFAHRAGLIQAMVPQAVEVWARDKSDVPWPERAEAHHVADQLLHLGYGAAAGSAYALLRAERNSQAKPSVSVAAGLGTALWVFGSFVLFPALRIARPPWRAKGSEEMVNLAAHLLYGTVTVYLLDELESQKRTQPMRQAFMRHARVG